MKNLMYGASVIAIAGLATPTVQAQDSTPAVQAQGNTPAPKAKTRRLKAVTVTATKRTETAQSIPVSVIALGESELDDLGVKNFTDYLVQLPGVTAGGSGPGQGTIYIRGLASTTPNLTTAGFAAWPQP